MAVNGIGGGRSPFDALGIAASGLTAQRTRIETIVENIANAETTRTAEGGPYRRKFARLVQDGTPVARETAEEPAVRGPKQPRAPFDPSGLVASAEETVSAPAGSVRVASIEADSAPLQQIYDPAHPDADADGFVAMPNVSITEEMVGLMESRRLYEANATVFDAVKQMLSRAARL